MIKVTAFILSIFLSLVPINFALASDAQDLLAHLELLAAATDQSKGFDQQLLDRIEQNSQAITLAILPKLADPKATEKQLAIYAWALGIAKDSRAADPLIFMCKNIKSEIVAGACIRALASLGDRKAGEFLLATLDTTKDAEKRYEILDSLAQMQFGAALPKTEEILKADPRQYYWKTMFIFGKMGDKAIPFLIEKIGSSDENVRVNALTALDWLIAKEAVTAIRTLYWKERSPERRSMILALYGHLEDDPVAIKKFSETVISREKEKKLVMIAQEMLDNNAKLKSMLADIKEKKQVSPESFKKQYGILYGSAGKKGDYDVLSSTSSINDEPELKKLRERILQRNSDEAFYDYEKANRIIWINRAIQHP